jgi:dephospho-CoA kinase
MRSGKDTLAELFNENFGLSFMSSSQAASDFFLYNQLKDKYGYTSPEECFNDRVNHREEWYLAICEYNKDNRARLAQDIVSRADCYVGMRDKMEFEECVKQKIFDLIIWVDASKRLPSEPSTSFNINMSDADIIVENNGTFEEFVEKSKRIGELLFSKNKTDVVFT